VKRRSGGDNSHFYEIVFENASDAIMVVDLESERITSANSVALELTGYLRDELVGNSVDLLFPPSDSLLPHTHSLCRDHVESSGFFEDIVLVSKDRYPRFVSLSVRVANVSGSRVAICILRDVAEKKSMERDLITKHTELRNAYVSLEKANAEMRSMQETLVQSGKLAALGELAAGIAHELNQPLTAVKGFAHEAVTALSKRRDPDAALSCLDEISRGADRMERIISHLRNFTRKSTADFELVDVHAIFEESLVMLDKQLKSRGITVEKHFGKQIPKVWANPFQLEQVFINLATNARDAIEARKSGRGRITITTSLASDGLVEIRYADDGVGIAEAVKGKIFNPFFTTKEVGKGMGLGLSISYGILARLNASILVESEIGKGTIFTIRLPVDYRKH
jgi:PAS domain S-box-containing protein